MLILSFNWLLNELKTFIKKENCVVFFCYILISIDFSSNILQL